jgi:hypothetical protein
MNQKLTNLLRELTEFLRGECSQILRGMHRVENSHISSVGDGGSKTPDAGLN